MEDIASLMEQLSLLPDNAELSCSAPALDELRMTIKRIPKAEKAELLGDSTFIEKLGDVYDKLLREM